MTRMTRTIFEQIQFDNPDKTYTLGHLIGLLLVEEEATMWSIESFYTLEDLDYLMQKDTCNI